MGRAGRTMAVPFGPFLAVRAIVGVLAGSVVAHAWLG
jgi:hypothetical protein